MSKEQLLLLFLNTYLWKRGLNKRERSCLVLHSTLYLLEAAAHRELKMGTDITGYIEVKFEWNEYWQAAIDLFWLYEGQYDSFACLFGVRNYAGFRPLAQDRGLPFDISPEVKQR